MKKLFAGFILGTIILCMLMCFATSCSTTQSHPDELYAKPEMERQGVIETDRWSKTVSVIHTDGDCFSYAIYFMDGDETRSESPMTHGVSYSTLNDAIEAANYASSTVTIRGYKMLERELYKCSCRYPEVIYHDEADSLPIILPNQKRL